MTGTPATVVQPAELFVQCLDMALGLTKLPAASHDLVIAHGAFESGWGRSLASRMGFNHWNLTAGPHWAGAIVPGPDKEPDGHGGWKAITQRFRAYPDHLHAVEDYLKFIGPGTRYEAAWAQLLAANAPEFVARLREAGYFTAPLAQYQAGIAACLSRVRALRSPRSVA